MGTEQKFRPPASRSPSVARGPGLHSVMVFSGYYKDDGKENRNYHITVLALGFRVQDYCYPPFWNISLKRKWKMTWKLGECRDVIWGFGGCRVLGFRGNRGIMEKKMETIGFI